MNVFLGQNGDGLIRRETLVSAGRVCWNGCAAASSWRFSPGGFGTKRIFRCSRFASDLRFDPIICADDVANGKPAPDGLAFDSAVMKPGAQS